MHFTLVGIGSRGDVQPYVALGLGLRAAGHDVRLAAYSGFRAEAERHGLAFTPIRYDPAALLRTEEGVSLLESGRNPITFLARMVAALRPLALQVAEDVLAATEDTDAIVGSTLALSAYHVAAARGVPYVGAFLQPLHRTRAFPAVVLPYDDLGPLLNRISGHVELLALELPFRAQMNRWRRERLGLPSVARGDFATRLDREHVLVLYGFSRWLVPKPDDWPSPVRLCGFWRAPRDRDWVPGPRLAAFLEDGPPPVYVGFGSMRPRDPARTSAVVVEALRGAGRRGIIAAGWAGLEAVGDDVLVAGEVPHDWLFPRCDAVVHHGGAGTTAAALRAGVPSFAVPFFADQFFWGARSARLGVGPRPIPVRRLEPAGLAAGIRAATCDRGMRAAAAATANRLAREDGVANAVAALDAAFGR